MDLIVTPEWNNVKTYFATRHDTSEINIRVSVFFSLYQIEIKFHRVFYLLPDMTLLRPPGLCFSLLLINRVDVKLFLSSGMSSAHY